MVAMEGGGNSDASTNYNYKSHYYKVICNWLACVYKIKLLQS